MTIVAFLNANKDKSPDEIVKALTVGRLVFHPCGLITRRVYEKLNFSERVCYFKWAIHEHGGQSWDNGEHDAQNVPMVTQRSFDNLYTNLEDWALVEYDRRFEVDPFTIDWPKYIEEYRNYVVSQ